MCTCQIRWIDDAGKPTPDSNVAIGCVWLPKRRELINGRLVDMAASERFPICADHAERLRDAGMAWWCFERFAP